MEKAKLWRLKRKMYLLRLILNGINLAGILPKNQVVLILFPMPEYLFVDLFLKAEPNKKSQGHFLQTLLFP